MINKLKVGYIIRFSGSFYEAPNVLAEIVKVEHLRDNTNQNSFVTRIWYVYDGHRKGILSDNGAEQGINQYLQDVYENSETAELLYS